MRVNKRGIKVEESGLRGGGRRREGEGRGGRGRVNRRGGGCWIEVIRSRDECYYEEVFF